MTALRRIAACLLIVAQAILALAVPGSAVHGERGDFRGEIRDPHACRGADGTWVLGIGGLGHHHRHLGDGHEHPGTGQGSDACCPHHGPAVCLECGDGHPHLHVANVDEVREGSRRWMLPPPAACGLVTVTVDGGERTPGRNGHDRPDRASRPPPSSRRALGSIVLRV